jgi:hypothetical protein
VAVLLLVDKEMLPQLVSLTTYWIRYNEYYDIAKGGSKEGFLKKL